MQGFIHPIVSCSFCCIYPPAGNQGDEDHQSHEGHEEHQEGDYQGNAFSIVGVSLCAWHGNWSSHEGQEHEGQDHEGQNTCLMKIVCHFFVMPMHALAGVQGSAQANGHAGFASHEGNEG